MPFSWTGRKCEMEAIAWLVCGVCGSKKDCGRRSMVRLLKEEESKREAEERGAKAFIWLWR